jgi:hypothetical protein
MTSAQTFKLLHAAEAPTVSAPSRQPSQDAVLWRNVGAGTIAQEIFRRDGGSFGLRYFAWVSQRDAGGDIRGHLWRSIKSADTLVTDLIAVAKLHADQDAATNGIDLFEPWRENV